MTMQIKRMKRMLLAMALCCAMFPTFAYATDLEEAPLTITSGLELYEIQKRVGVNEGELEVIVAEVVEDVEAEEVPSKPQVTFEKNRVIYGEALSGTTITLLVEQLEDEEWILSYAGEQTANSLGMFSFVMPLEVGKNQITLIAETEGYESVCYQLQMERISEDVKEQLKALVALPALMQTNKG